MGNGFNEIYPPENESLAREIASHGAVVTEMPMAAGPMRYNFPRRNRIISGLSLGVLVVEAAPRSGALITVGFALQQGRDVFAVPGKIDSSASEGPNRLIQEGAKLVVTVRDIIEEYPWLASADHRKTAAAPDICAGGGPEERGREGLTCAESELSTIISKQPATFDDLVGETGRRVDELAEILMNMRLKKFITQAGAKFYIRSMHGC
jgi:DNA processing protein